MGGEFETDSPDKIYKMKEVNAKIIGNTIFCLVLLDVLVLGEFGIHVFQLRFEIGLELWSFSLHGRCQ